MHSHLKYRLPLLIIGRCDLTITGAFFAMAALLSNFMLIETSASAAQDTDRSKVDAARQAWESRQEKIRTASFTFISKRILPADSSMHPQRLLTRLGRIPKQEILDGGEPTADRTYEVRHVVKLYGGKVREYNESPPQLRDGSMPLDETRTSLETFDGNDSRALTTLSIEGKYDQGFIRDSAELPIRTQIVYAPIFLTYRAMSPQLIQFAADSMIDTDEVGTVAGKRCLIFAEEGRHDDEYWVDPSCNYCIVRRILRDSSGKPLVQLDVMYEMDDRYGPVPVNWVVQRFEPSGKLKQRVEVVVNSYEFNVPIPEEEFRIDFPVDALITDQRGGAEKMYIVRTNGGKRPIQQGEFGRLSYEQLRDSEPGELLFGGTSRWSSLRIGMFVLTAVVLVLLSIIVLQNRRTQYEK